MFTRRLLVAAASVSLLAPLSPALAQGDAPAAPAAPSKPIRPAPPQLPGQADSNPGPIISVEFAGGTTKQYVDAVRQAADPMRVNVVLPKEADGVPLPAISLRNVTTHTALQAIEYAVDPNGASQFSIGRLGKGDESSVTFAIRFNSRAGLPQAAGFVQVAKPETRVVSVTDLIEAPAGLEKDPTMAASMETILNALKAASQLDMNANVSPPEIMFHRDSQLLIIRGTSEQLRTMESVIGSLAQSLNSRRADAAKAAEREKNARLQKAEMQAQMELNQSQQKLAAAEMDRARANLERVSELVKSGQVSSVEASNAKAQFDQTQAIFEQARAAERSLRERQTILEAREQAGGGMGSAGAAEVPVMVIYDFADLEPFAGDVWGIMSSVVKLRGGQVEMKHDVRGRGTLSLRATPAEHAVIVKALNAMRRAKANEPKLPGLDAEDLIRKSQDK